MSAVIPDNETEIERLAAETVRLTAEAKYLEAKSRKLAAETTLEMQARIEKMSIENRQIAAETAKIMRETRWHPVAVLAASIGTIAALIGATVAAVKIFFP